MKDDYRQKHATWPLIDAWQAIPPCTYKSEPFCHVDCPYFYDCNGYPDNLEEEEQW